MAQPRLLHEIEWTLLEHIGEAFGENGATYARYLGQPLQCVIGSRPGKHCGDGLQEPRIVQHREKRRLGSRRLEMIAHEDKKALTHKGFYQCT